MKIHINVNIRIELCYVQANGVMNLKWTGTNFKWTALQFIKFVASPFRFINPLTWTYYDSILKYPANPKDSVAKQDINYQIIDLLDIYMSFQFIMQLKSLKTLISKINVCAVLMLQKIGMHSTLITWNVLCCGYLYK